MIAPEWIESYEWNNRPKDDYIKGLHRLETFNSTFFVYFCKSILSGEYIKKTKQVLNYIDDFQRVLAHENERFFPETEAGHLKFELYKEYKSTEDWIKTSLLHYKGLISTVIDKIEIAEHNYIFNASSRYDHFDSSHSLSDIVRYVIPICKMDHSLSYDNDSITNLILIREELKNKGKASSDSDIGLVYTIVLDKCSFLLKKLLFISGKSEYSLDFKTYFIDDNDIETTTFDWLNKGFDFLHKDIENKELVSLWQRKCATNNIRTSEIVMLMKHYQKHGGSLMQINNLITYFDDKLYNKLFHVFIKDKFNTHALKTIKNYLYNSRLSFKTKQKKYSYKELLEDMEVIENLQKETFIKNFYPYRKALLFLVDDITKDLNNRLGQTDLIDEKIQKLREYIEIYENNLRWCCNINFYPFQLLFNECGVKYESLGIYIFIPSSFSRPIEYKSLKDELITVKNQISFFENKRDFLEEKMNIENIKQEISKNERKYMEILGVFMTVSAFLFGTIDFLSQGNGKDVLITSVLAFGVLLLLFNSGLYFITMQREQHLGDYLKHPRFLFFLASTIIYLSILVKTCLVNL